MVQRKPRTRVEIWDPAALPEPVTVGRGRQAVAIRVVAVGRDLLVTVTGGQAHAGAVAMAAPKGVAPGARALVIPPHKEGPLAEECARLVAEAAGCTCVAVAGIHQDAAAPGEITAIVANARSGMRTLAAALARVPADQRYCSDRLPKPRTP